MASDLTGYGPSSRLLFSGDEERYELWEEKFCGYLTTRKLHEVLTETTPDPETNRRVYGELVQFLDDRSLSLIIRDAKNDGKKAIEILRSHYLGKGMPRVLNLYTQLTSLKMMEKENTTDYMVRAETAATLLKAAGEVISDSLLIAMILKGLPIEFKMFRAVIGQKKTLTFSEFKVELRTFEESEKPYKKCEDDDSTGIMNFRDRQRNFQVKCFACGKLGHISKECYSKQKPQEHRPSKRWCFNCKSGTHFTAQCRNGKKEMKKVNNDSAKNIMNEAVGLGLAGLALDTKDFSFVNTEGHSESKGKVYGNNLMVDSGATAHIISGKEKFVNFEENFVPRKHLIELADGSKMS